jgi:hypothetical protein
VIDGQRMADAALRTAFRLYLAHRRPQAGRGRALRWRRTSTPRWQRPRRLRGRPLVRQLRPAERKRILIRFADLMLANRDELALLETLDMGKPIRYSRSVDVRLAQNCIRWYGEAIDKIYDEIAPTAARTAWP